MVTGSSSLRSGHASRIALRTALAYLAIAGLWIVASDRLVEVIDFPQTWNHSTLQTYKGWAFVAVTALLLYLGLKGQITRLEQANLALAGTEARYRELVENANSIIMRLDMDGRVTYFNEYAERFFGYRSEEIIGRHGMGTIVPTTDSSGEDLSGLVNEIVSNPSRFATNRNENMRRDGERVWVAWTNRVVTDDAGNVVEILCVGNDITTEKMAEDAIRDLNTDLEHRVEARTVELKAANEELESFAYAVSHDLRAPLRAMSGFSQALVEDYADKLDDQARVYVDQIAQGARRMGQLIDGLLALSRCTRGGLAMETVDISAIAERILSELKLNDSERRVSWSVEPRLVCAGDARMLEVALGNLLDNAWKYTGNTPDARIDVRGEWIDGQPFVVVEDNGAGFDMTYADKLFQPFQRLHRQDEFPGIGVGLATVRRIANRHGGKVIAESTPGRGARVGLSIVLPDRQEDEA